MKYTFFKISLILALSIPVFSPQHVYGQSDVSTKADSLLKAKKHFSFAVQYKKSGSLDQARINYEQSIAYNDTVYQVHYSYGDLLMKLERPAEARGEFARSLELNPDHFNSASMLAKLYYTAAVYDSALYAYEAMHRIEPDKTAILATIAGLREYLGLKEEALDAYEALIDAGEASFDNRMKAAKLCIATENWDRADVHVKAALDIEPDNAEALSLATGISTKRGNASETVTMLRRIAEGAPDDVSALIKLEKAARSTGDNEALAWALERHIAITDDNRDIHAELIDIVSASGDDALSQKYIDRALESYPSDGRFRILKGNYFRTQGNDERALAEYRIALSDEKWKSSAQQFIWQIEPPKTDDERAEQEFFKRGNSKGHSHKNAHRHSHGRQSSD